MNEETAMLCLRILEIEMKTGPTLRQVTELYEHVMELVREFDVPHGTPECSEDENRPWRKGEAV